MQQREARIPVLAAGSPKPVSDFGSLFLSSVARTTLGDAEKSTFAPSMRLIR
jgi:hypothetical protein